MKHKLVMPLAVIFLYSLCSFVIGVTINVKYGTTPVMDGNLTPESEWNDSDNVTFETLGGNATVYFKEDGSSLYMAFEVPNNSSGSALQVFLDTEHNQETAPQTDDYRLTITHNDGALSESPGNGSQWIGGSCCPGWNASRTKKPGGWQAEFNISYSKLNITANISKTMRVSFWNPWVNGTDYYWPPGLSYTNPTTWADASSSYRWGSGPESVGVEIALALGWNLISIPLII